MSARLSSEINNFVKTLINKNRQFYTTKIRNKNGLFELEINLGENTS